MVLDTSPPCSGSAAIAEIPGINAQDHPETAEPSPKGPVATDAQTDWPAEVGSPAVVPPSTTHTPARSCTIPAEDVQLPTGIRSVIFQL